MQFGYVKDPLFIICVAIYPLNRFVFKEIWDSGFVHDHLNDLICIPFIVPIMLYIERKLGLRKHDLIPQWYEVIIPVLVIAFVFEIVLPSVPFPGQPMIADHMDVFFYVLGALTGAVFWRLRYSQSRV